MLDKFDKRKAQIAEKRRRDKQIEDCKRTKGHRGDKKDRKKIKYDDREVA